MIRQQGSIYTNFEVPPFPEKASKQIRALIMGYCGNGKTLFLNNMSGKKHKTGISRGTLTRQIVYEDSCFLPERALRIYDTPGTNSRKQAMLHALILRRSITSLPLNLILIQAKFDSRFEDSTLMQLKSQANIFEQYETNLVFLISHLDVLEKQEEDEKQRILEDLVQAIEDIKMKAKIIMYSNIQSDFSQLTKILYTVGYGNEQVAVQINDQSFYRNFKITDISPQLVNREIEGYIKEVKDVADAYINAFKNVPPQEHNIDDYIADLKRDMINDLKHVKDSQYKHYSETFEMHQAADLYLLISQIIHVKMEELDLLTDARLQRKVYFQMRKTAFDIKDLLKKCPRCGLIWMRVEGCEGETFCGGKPRQFDLSQSKDQAEYSFRRERGKLEYVKSSRKELTQQQLNKAISERENNSGKKESLGCKAKLVWNQLPRLENIEDLLKELYHVSNFQQVKLDHQKMMKKNEEMEVKANEQLKKVEYTISRSMYE